VGGREARYYYVSSGGVKRSSRIHYGCNLVYPISPKLEVRLFGVVLTVSLNGARINGVKLMVSSSRVRVRMKASRVTPKCSGPPAAVRMATEVQFIAVSAVVSTAVQTIANFRRSDQLKGFYSLQL
jgi:hypothetical protein